MSNSLVLMTALPPTTGHLDLIDFAKHLSTKVYVGLYTLSEEPMGRYTRKMALNRAVGYSTQVIVRGTHDDSAPQAPEDHPDFWNWWKEAIHHSFPDVEKWDYVVASEEYGAPLAESLGATFMPFDIKRELNPVTASEVRRDLVKYWDQILPGVRQWLQVTGVVFGQESVGKTTVSKRVAEILGGTWGFEYARPYLETIGPDIDMKVMDRIHTGQLALQRSLSLQARKPFTVLDTDLWSTVGYYPILDQGPAPASLLTDAANYAGDMYYVLDDGIPFEEDILRYGGDVRTSTKEYWVRLLQEHKIQYVLVPLGTVDEEAEFISAHMRELFAQKNSDLSSYVRPHH